MNTVELLFQILCLGVGATLIIDMWLLLLKKLNQPTLNFALLGRWVGWMFRGKFIHASIAQSPAIRREYALGWLAHYSVGILFAFSFVLMVGDAWLRQPQFSSALIFGVITVLIPFFIMQPAMGAGIASAKTAQPLQNCLRSLINHAIFGCGLYLSAQVLALFQ
ncbi:MULTISPECIES: DUF2938 domain-containing protein [Acinetobacter]|uniref:DUF2938 domain-containing protein n=1 Tax=Acinetobacter genomosp. 15BJ TaxID=106651 RepID=R9AJH4_9GAMM|nr:MULTISPECIES: DUF2938 domain-containing protein [Acinetobacter]EOR02378.1 hypothetical protein F896_04065 [Acinetobacter genomosp. 15BJ]MCH7292544.1 DUF2938 domain-containing protein [Acinetobacter genomosp. 15BJ]MCI3880704.1 DUF2938 domain-containing protein [Acinetobacter higginsii]MDO3658919.1 DUF2938 domain-containing protein [Acinetobacter genomosp. 15BJ]